MPPRKYNNDQKAALALIGDIHAEHIDKKLKLRQKIAKAFEDQMVDVELKKSRAMNEALALGVAKTDIGRAIGTANFQTVKDLLERTAGDLTVIDVHPFAKLIKWNPARENFTVTSPTGESYPMTADGRENQTTHIGPTGEDWDVLPDSFPSDDFRAWFAANHGALVAYMREARP